MVPKTFMASFLLSLFLLGCGRSDTNASKAGNAAAQSDQAEIAAPAASGTSDGPATGDALNMPPLTREGWGPLKVGMTLAEVIAAAGPDADPEAVGGADPAACDQFRPARAPDGLLVMVEQGRLSRISLIDDSSIRTDKGIAVGDNAAAVEKAYGPAAIASPHEYADRPAAYIDVWAGGGGGPSFAPPPSARGIRYEIDGRNVVGAIHAGGPSIQYVEGCS